MGRVQVGLVLGIQNRLLVFVHEKNEKYKLIIKVYFTVHMRRRSKKKKSTHEGDLKQFLLMVIKLYFDFEGSYFMRKS